MKFDIMRINVKNNSKSKLAWELKIGDLYFYCLSWEWDIFPENNFFVTFEELNSNNEVVKRMICKVSDRQWDKFNISEYSAEECVQNDTENPKTYTKNNLSFKNWSNISLYFTALQYKNFVFRNEMEHEINIKTLETINNYPYQKIEDVRWIVILPRDEKFKNNNTHFWFIDWWTIGLPWAWYDIITFNWRVADNYIHHPIKQLALGPDWIFFRRQNWDNSWSEWQKITTNDKIAEELKIDTLREKSNFDSWYDFFILQSFSDKKNFKLTWENLLWNIKNNIKPQLVYDSWELTLSTWVSMIDHNLNINKEDFVIWRYKMLLIQGTSYNTSFTFEDNLSSSWSNPATNSNRARIYLYNYNSPRVLKIYKFW